MLNVRRRTEYFSKVIQVLLSASLLNALEVYEKIVMIIFVVFLLIIEILYAAASLLQ